MVRPHPTQIPALSSLHIETQGEVDSGSGALVRISDNLMGTAWMDGCHGRK